MKKTLKWYLAHTDGHYFDFDKEVMSMDDEGNTSLDVRLTFDVQARRAYMTVAWHNNDGNTVDLDGQRNIEWNAALRMLEADNCAIPSEIEASEIAANVSEGAQ